MAAIRHKNNNTGIIIIIIILIIMIIAIMGRGVELCAWEREKYGRAGQGGWNAIMKPAGKTTRRECDRSKPGVEDTDRGASCQSRKSNGDKA